MTEADQWIACWLIIIFGMIFIFAFIAWQMSKGHAIDCAVDTINRASEMRIAALLREEAAKGGNKVFAASDTKAMDEYLDSLRNTKQGDAK